MRVVGGLINTIHCKPLANITGKNYNSLNINNLGVCHATGNSRKTYHIIPGTGSLVTVRAALSRIPAN